MEKEAIGVERQKKQIAFREAFRFWVKLGFINFGGPRAKLRLCTAS